MYSHNYAGVSAWDTTLKLQDVSEMNYINVL